MRALVTGGSGFIGLHLCRALLDRGEHVTALVRDAARARPLQDMGADLCWGEIRDGSTYAPALRDCNVVFHLAGLTRSLDSREYYAVNEQGTRMLLEQIAREVSPPVIVVVSSLAAAGPSRERPRLESDDPQPVSHYGRSKRGAEVIAEKFAKQIPISIVRPPIVFGPGNRQTLPMFRSVSRYRVHARPSWQRRWFSLIHVEDLVVQLLNIAETGERLPGAGDDAARGRGYYFVSSGPPVLYPEIGAMINRALGRRLLLHLPIASPLIWAIGGMASLAARWRGRAGSMSWDKAREAVAGSWTCDATKANTQFAFATPRTLQQRFDETVIWYRQQGWL